MGFTDRKKRKGFEEKRFSARVAAEARGRSPLAFDPNKRRTSEGSEKKMGGSWGKGASPGNKRERC